MSGSRYAWRFFRGEFEGQFLSYVDGALVPQWCNPAVVDYITGVERLYTDGDLQVVVSHDGGRTYSPSWKHRASTAWCR
jgi:hypothetical protein